MNKILEDLSPAALARAIKANLYAYFGEFRRSTAAEFAENSAWARWRTPLRHPWFSGLLSKQPPGGQEAELIRETLDYFRARQVETITWWLAPDLDADAWGQVLLPHGFGYSNDTPGMALDLSQLGESGGPLENLTIQVVEELEQLKVWADIFMPGYGLPEEWSESYYHLLAGLGLGLPLRHYLGYWDGAPVATSTLYLGAGAAGIYNVASLPQARGRGFGSALTLLPLLEARQMGFKVGVLQSSPMGLSVYRRLGFQQYCAVDYFYWRDPNFSG